MKRGYFAVLIFVLAIIASVICNEDMQISDSDAHPALSAEPEGQVWQFDVDTCFSVHQNLFGFRCSSMSPSAMDGHLAG